VVYKELELQEKRQVLDILNEDEIKNYFKKDKKNITLDDLQRKDIKTKKNSWEFGVFGDVEKMNEYQVLYSKNLSVNQEFHGNRDFCVNVIRDFVILNLFQKIMKIMEVRLFKKLKKL